MAAGLSGAATCSTSADDHTWIGATDNDWHVATNWSQSVVPNSPTNSAIFTSVATGTRDVQSNLPVQLEQLRIYQSNSAGINSLSATQDILMVDAPLLSSTQGAILLNLQYGPSRLPQLTWTDTGSTDYTLGNRIDLNFAGDSASGTNGAFGFAGNTVVAGSTFTVAQGAIARGGGARLAQNFAQLINNGTIRADSGTLVVTSSISSTGTGLFEATNGGRLQFQGGGQINGAIKSLSNGSDETTIEVSSPGKLLNIGSGATVDMNLSSKARFVATSGGLNFLNEIELTGSSQSAMEIIRRVGGVTSRAGNIGFGNFAFQPSVVNIGPDDALPVTDLRQGGWLQANDTLRVTESVTFTGNGGLVSGQIRVASNRAVVVDMTQQQNSFAGEFRIGGTIATESNASFSGIAGADFDVSTPLPHNQYGRVIGVIALMNGTGTASGVSFTNRGLFKLGGAEWNLNTSTPSTFPYHYETNRANNVGAGVGGTVRVTSGDGSRIHMYVSFNEGSLEFKNTNDVLIGTDVDNGTNRANITGVALRLGAGYRQDAMQFFGIENAAGTVRVRVSGSGGAKEHGLNAAVVSGSYRLISSLDIDRALQVYPGPSPTGDYGDSRATLAIDQTGILAAGNTGTNVTIHAANLLMRPGSVLALGQFTPGASTILPNGTKLDIGYSGTSGAPSALYSYSEGTIYQGDGNVEVRTWTSRSPIGPGDTLANRTSFFENRGTYDQVGSGAFKFVARSSSDASSSSNANGNSAVFGLARGNGSLWKAGSGDIVVEKSLSLAGFDNQLAIGIGAFKPLLDPPLADAAGSNLAQTATFTGGSGTIRINSMDGDKGETVFFTVPSSRFEGGAGGLTYTRHTNSTSTFKFINNGYFGTGTSAAAWDFTQAQTEIGELAEFHMQSGNGTTTGLLFGSNAVTIKPGAGGASFNVNSAVTHAIPKVAFEHSTSLLSKTGAGTLTLSGFGTIASGAGLIARAGTVEFAGAHTAGASLNVNVSNGAAVNFLASQTLKSLTVSGNVTLPKLTGNEQRTVLTQSLTITNGTNGIGRIDVGKSFIIVDWDSGNPTDEIADYIRSGMNSTNSAGIFSSLSGFPGTNANHIYRVGWFDTSIPSSSGNFPSETNLASIALPYDASSTLIRLTLAGDTDLDGAVTFADLIKVNANVGNTNAAWFQGDFDYDGAVTFVDTLMVSANFGHSMNESGAPSLPVSIPEPALPGIAVASLYLLQKRRRFFLTSSQ